MKRILKMVWKVTDLVKAVIRRPVKPVSPDHCYQRRTKRWIVKLPSGWMAHETIEERLPPTVASTDLTAP